MKRFLAGLTCFLALSIVATSISAGPLQIGEFSLIPYGGVAPSTFTKRKTSTLAIHNRIFQAKTPNYQALLEFPWIFGGSIGYNVTDQLEVFFSSDYITSKGGKKVVARSLSTAAYPGLSRLKYDTGTFGALGFYLGGRYYIDCGGKWYPFMGGRFGVHFRKTVDCKVYLDNQRIAKTDCFKSHVTFAAGAHIGLDAELAEYVDFIFMAEVLGSGRLKRPKDGFPLFNRMAGMISFPITFGLRFRVY